MGKLSDDKDLLELFDTFQKTREEIVKLLHSHGGPVTTDYVFSEGDRTDVPFAELFGDRPDLLVIHNMGKSCRYCTLWADGLNGMLPHLTSRTSVVLVSPDTPETQREFADSRDWRFRMISDQAGTFTSDLHFTSEHEGKMYVLPGVSAFHRNEDGTITHVASDFFGPGDNYMPVFPLFELLKDGIADWQPQYSYQQPTQIDLPNS